MIDFSCGRGYNGETGCSLHKRLKEHEADIENERSHFSALGEHSSKTKHHVCLKSASSCLFKKCLDYHEGRTLLKEEN